MKSLSHPQLVNDPSEDPALCVGFLFEKRALPFDLGDISSLATRRVLRLSHIFVSHTHMDHFMGFDRMLCLCLGRDKALHLRGPPGFIERVVDGQTIAYVADVVYHEGNARRIVNLARDAEFLFIETTFLEEDVHLAAEKYHLTARRPLTAIRPSPPCPLLSPPVSKPTGRPGGWSPAGGSAGCSA